jgi:hypothetical protein
MNLSMLFAIITCLSLAWITGTFVKIVFRFNPEDDVFLDTFTKLLIGLFFIIIVYAIIVTGFNTVLLGMILLAALYLFRNRKREKLNRVFKKHFNPKYLKSFSIALLFGIIFFVLQGLFFYNTPFNNIPHGDYTGYYSRIIDFLSYNGVESRTTALYLIIEGNDFPTPYHYSELWLASLIMETFKVLSIESFTIAVHSILATILAVGMLSLSRIIFKSIVLQIYAVLFLFVSGFSLYDILPQTSSYFFALGWNPKVIIVSVFFVWFSVLLYKRNKFFYYPLLCLPIVNIGLAPAILTSLAIFALYNLIFKKQIFCEVKHVLVDSIILGLFIIIYYFVNSINVASGDFSYSNIITGLSLDKLKPLKIISGTIFIIIYIYIFYIIPIILVIFSKFRKQFFSKLKQIGYHLVFFILFFGFGLLYWCLVHPIHDSIQFFYMAAILYFNILLFIIYVKAFELLKENKVKYYYVFNIIISILIVYNLFTLPQTPFYNYKKMSDIYSENYLNSIKEKMEERDNGKIQIIGYISVSENLRDYWKALVSGSADVGLSMVTSNYYLINLNAFNIPLSF